MKKRGWIPPVSRCRRLGSGLIFTVDRSVDGSGVTPPPLGIHTPPPLFIGDRARFVERELAVTGRYVR